MDVSIIFVFVAILVVAAGLFALITVTKGGAKRLDVDRYRSKWLAIEQQLVDGQPASYHLSVLNADKLLDQAMREKGIKGQTMGERLKQVTWTNANAVWAAHKLRNQIAHEPDVVVKHDTARRALASFKQGLKDIGAI